MSETKCGCRRTCEPGWTFAIILILWGGSLGVVLLNVTGGLYADGRDDLRAEAAALGHAEYVVTDPKTGATEWRWKERP